MDLSVKLPPADATKEDRRPICGLVICIRTEIQRKRKQTDFTEFFMELIIMAKNAASNFSTSQNLREWFN
jgi:hypothetical protein